MPNLMEILKILPTYIIELVQKYSIAACIAAVVFIFILFFSNKVASFFRKAFVFAVIIICVYAYFRDNWNLMTAAICSVLVLAIVRLIGYIITTIRTNRRNKRIEERALERAAKRRGSWKNKQGYSGARKLIEEPQYVPEEMNKEEIAAVIDNEMSYEEPADITVSSDAATEDLPSSNADVEAITDELNDVNTTIDSTAKSE